MDVTDLTPQPFTRFQADDRSMTSLESPRAGHEKTSVAFSPEETLHKHTTSRIQFIMVRRGKATKRPLPAPTDYSCSHGTTIIRGTSTRPLISFQANQPAVILADIAEPIPEAKPPQLTSNAAEDEKLESDHPSEMEDDRLYCVCRTLYDGRTMIACDRCDNWYHNDCVGIEDDSVGLVDIFICPNCQTGADKQTTWKKKCARHGCHLAARLLSKYCSDWCGIERAANRLSNATTDYHRFWEAVRTATKPEGLVTIELEEPNESSTSRANENIETDILLNQRAKQLEELLAKKSEVETQVELAMSRAKYLRYAISRWENMCLATARALQIQENLGLDESAATTSTSIQPKKGGGSRARGKAKSGAKKSETSFLSSATSSAEAPCGFDVRLIWDDKDWAQWASSEGFSALLRAQESANIEPASENATVENNHPTPEAATVDHGIEEGVICLIMRKKCDRHVGWQKTRENDFQTEVNTLEGSRKKLRHVKSFQSSVVQHKLSTDPSPPRN
ncbi:hypothetical protein PCANC_19107 [Puccinia coronata f. sp. avenae]|uniref:PHD-type domain-containing protein n=1 Tax=Puccinia coronata f. sp. avenae TaxID=200324 RepID=A0A2N5SSF3_9BASI|nr:hypothetical protein PCANC_19107 [Puccinia coronata f. sp. avenae]